MRTLTIISGVLMLAGGVFCFVNPGQTFMTMAFPIGAIMVINGVIHAVAYLVGRGPNNKGDNNGWILIDALITLVLGVLILFNQLFIDAAVPLVFGMWMLTSGFLRLEAASRIDRVRKGGNFKVTVITGIMTVVIGIFGLVNPLMSFVSIIVLVGIFLIMQGINILELGINMPHKKGTYIKVYNRRKRKAMLITDEEETEEARQERLLSKVEEDKQEEALETIGVKVENPEL